MVQILIKNLVWNSTTRELGIPKAHKSKNLLDYLVYFCNWKPEMLPFTMNSRKKLQVEKKLISNQAI